MGQLRSNHDHSGLIINSVTLGDPVQATDTDGNPIGEYRWDDARLPSGVIEVDGTITPDEEGDL